MATHSTTAAEGSEAPRFELPDAQGIAHSLDSLLTRGPVVLVFLRGFA
jgi:peroxiredoxin